MANNFALKVKRGETPFYRMLGTLAKRLQTSDLPTPRFINSALRVVFHIHQAVWNGAYWAAGYFYIGPVFRSRCISVGRHFRISRMPYVCGHAQIQIGDNVNFFGKVDIFSGRMFDEPKLIIKDRVDIGHNVIFVVTKKWSSKKTLTWPAGPVHGFGRPPQGHGRADCRPAAAPR